MSMALGRLLVAAKDAASAYERADYATALRLIRPLAEQGNASAQNNLGLMYANGQGAPQDYVQAHKWLISLFRDFRLTIK